MDHFRTEPWWAMEFPGEHKPWWRRRIKAIITLMLAVISIGVSTYDGEKEPVVVILDNSIRIK